MCVGFLYTVEVSLLGRERVMGIILGLMNEMA